MSAAKMVADSTQSDDPAIKKNKINAKKNKKGKKTAEKKSSKKKLDKEEPTDPNLDLSKEVHPIGYYWKSKSEMLDQMFDSVQGSSLTMILPEVLMDVDIKDLKIQCLEHLEVMSKKRVFRILSGADPDDISSSESEDEAVKDVGDGHQAADSTSNNSPTNDNKTKAGDELTDSSNTEKLEDKVCESKSGDDSHMDSKDEEMIVTKEDKISSDSESRSPNVDDKTRLDKTSSTDKMDTAENNRQDCESVEEGELTENSESASLIPMLTQNHMELLELEMRARAIKAMLKAQESHSTEPT